MLLAWATGCGPAPETDPGALLVELRPQHLDLFYDEPPNPLPGAFGDSLVVGLVEARPMGAAYYVFLNGRPAFRHDRTAGFGLSGGVQTQEESPDSRAAQAAFSGQLFAALERRHLDHKRCRELKRLRDYRGLLTRRALAELAFEQDVDLLFVVRFAFALDQPPRRPATPEDLLDPWRLIFHGASDAKDPLQLRTRCDGLLYDAFSAELWPLPPRKFTLPLTGPAAARRAAISDKLQAAVRQLAKEARELLYGRDPWATWLVEVEKDL